MKRYTRGFTLIELLVVIAIIGILASVVLVSLQSARNKGKDSRVISDVQQIRIQLEADLSSTGVYQDLYNATINSAQIAGSPVTAVSANITALVADAVAQGGAVTYVIATNGTTGSLTVPNATAYAIYGSLPSAPTTYFCIDSTGKTKMGDAQKATITCSS